MGRLLAQYLNDADESAMEEIVRCSRPRLLAVARRIGRAQDAEDTVQTAYCALLRRRELAPGAPLMAWLITAVVRIAYRRKATENRQRDLANRLGLAFETSEPAALLQQSEEARLVAQAVHELPAAYRDPAILHYLQGLSIRETAEVMGLCESTVATRLHRARALLRFNLAPRISGCIFFLPWLLADALKCLLPVRVVIGASANKSLAVAAIIATVAVSAMIAFSEDPDSTVQDSGVANWSSPLTSVSNSTAPPTQSAPSISRGEAPAEPALGLEEQPLRLGTGLDSRESERSWSLEAEVAHEPRSRVDVRMTEVRPLIITSVQEDGELDAALKSDPISGLFLLLDRGLTRWESIRSYRAQLLREVRVDGVLQDREHILTMFHQPLCLRMDWLDQSLQDRKILYVQGAYDNQLCLQTKVMFVKARLAKKLDDPDILRKSHHPLTASTLGAVLLGLRELSDRARQADDLAVEYHGLQVDELSGQRYFELTRYLISRNDSYRTTFTLLRIDAESLMPIFLEAHDAKGLLERYQWRNLELNPQLSNGSPAITERDFYRSVVFSDDRDWSVPESWTFADLIQAIDADADGASPNQPTEQSAAGEFPRR